jgi:hypothetical protein
VQLSRPGPPPPPPDLPTGLAARARDLGQRPAVSVLTVAGRAEQGFVTLAQWAAKGAHLLELDHAAGPGVEVFVDVPAGWPLAAVAAAVWWTGAAVRLGEPGDADVGIVHSSRGLPDVEHVLLVGDAVDGSPVDDTDLPVWALEVQAFPDQPPTPRATPRSTAVLAPGGIAMDHAEVVTRAAGLGAVGPLGLTRAGVRGEPLIALLAVAARPLVTGSATVVLDGVGPDAADGDRVASWLPT